MFLTDKIRGAVNKVRYSSLKTYGSYREAQEASGMGYEDKELVEVIVSKTIQNRHLLNEAQHLNSASLGSLTSVLYSLDKFDSINVIDLGGGTGLQYHVARALIKNDKKLNWYVVESTALAEKCKPLFSTDELQFKDDLEKAIEAAKEVHLIHCSGVIQYMPDPYEITQKIAQSNAHYLIFSRMCFSKKGKDIVILQPSTLSGNGFGPMPSSFTDRKVLYPQTSIQKNKFFGLLEKNYKTVFTFQDDSGVHYPEWQEGLGVLMQRKVH